MEISLYKGREFPFTAEWYKTREHAPHVDQPIHQPRMEAVADLAFRTIRDLDLGTVCDLGAGDGGMLGLVGYRCPERQAVKLWGYDLMEVNCEYAQKTRHEDVRYRDFVEEPIEWADLTIITECLEHLENPHGMVRRIGRNSKAIIASSPAKETSESHDACHAWVWDTDGYASLIEQGGFQVADHFTIEGDYDFQIILGVKP